MRNVGELSDCAVGVYRSMLRWPNWDAERIGDHLGLGGAQVLAAMDELAGLALLRESAGGGLAPVRPDLGVTMLLDRQRELDSTRQAVAAVAAEFAGEPTDDGVERVDGADAVRGRTLAVIGRADREIALCLPAGQDGLIDERLLRVGAPIRVLVEDSACLGPVLGVCGRVKCAPALPTALVLCDGDTAVLPVGPASALLIHTPHLVAALRALFEKCWSAATDLGTGDDELTAQERQVLSLLSRGVTDEMAGHRLGLSARSVRRVMAGLMTRLGARSRFQAGQLAAQRGWL